MAKFTKKLTPPVVLAIVGAILGVSLIFLYYNTKKVTEGMTLKEASENVAVAEKKLGKAKADLRDANNKLRDARQRGLNNLTITNLTNTMQRAQTAVSDAEVAKTQAVAAAQAAAAAEAVAAARTKELYKTA